MEAYLFVHFLNTDTVDSEQIYFAVSRNGMKWVIISLILQLYKMMVYYRFSKDETFKSIIMEVVDYNMTHLARSEKDS